MRSLPQLKMEFDTNNYETDLSMETKQFMQARSIYGLLKICWIDVYDKSEFKYLFYLFLLHFIFMACIGAHQCQASSSRMCVRMHACGTITPWKSFSLIRWVSHVKISTITFRNICRFVNNRIDCSIIDIGAFMDLYACNLGYLIRRSVIL